MVDVDQLLTRFLAELDQAGVGPYSAVLHGSAARGEYLPGWSDVNLVLVFDQLSAASLRRLAEPVRRWRGDAGALPLLFTREEWLRSADAYPLEIAEMRSAYRVLRGTDPLEGLGVERADLRAALERELRGKLLRLRQGYTLLAGQPEELSEFMRRSVSSVLFLCRGLILLTGATPAASPEAVVAQAARLAGFEPGAVTAVLGHRTDQGWRPAEAVMEAYLRAVETVARYVDHYKTGDQE